MYLCGRVGSVVWCCACVFVCVRARSGNSEVVCKVGEGPTQKKLATNPLAAQHLDFMLAPAL